MTPEQFRRVEQLFEAACELPAGDRRGFAERAAADDPVVLAALTRLLDADARAGRESGAFAGALAAVRAAAREAEPAPLPPRIGEFTIVRTLGRGGMGVVYEAEQHSPRRRVALKVVRDAEFVDPVAVRMFEREAEALGRLRHPNIAAVYGSGRTDEGRPWFAMELVHGATLDAHLRGRPPLDSQAELHARLRIFATLASAVHYAHQRGVIHRDLKPGNILVGAAANAPDSRRGTAPQEVKILDFGLARIVDAERDVASMVTEVGVIKGTLPYMSPEQARGRSDQIDLRTDVYSLGVILYEMLAGARPYSVEHAAITEVLRVICEATPPPLHKTARGSTTRVRLDADLDSIVQKALAKETGRRYGSAQALSEDVERFLASQPILARPPSATYQLRKMFERHRAAFMFGGAALAALCVAAVVSTMLYFRAERESERARTEATKQAETARFLDETLQAAGPSVALGRDTTLMREVLDRAAARIDLELRDQPAVEAFVRTSLGAVYVTLGQYPEAAEQLDSALHVQATLKDVPPGDRAKLLKSLGTQRWLAGQPAAAEPIFRQALELRATMHPDGHSFLAQSMTDLGNVLVAQGRYEEAQPLLEGALAMVERVGAAHTGPAAITTNSLANLVHHRGDLLRAEALYRRALDLEVELLGPLHPDTITTRSNLGLVLRSKGEWIEAERVILVALADARIAFGDGHPNTVETMQAAAHAQRTVGKLAEAEQLAREALTRARTLYPGANSSLANAITTLALVLDARDLDDEAAALYREALDTHRAAGSPPGDIASGLNNLAHLLKGRRRYPEALAMQQEALATERQRLGDEHHTVLLLRNNLGRIQAAMHDLDAAEATYQAVIADRRRLDAKAGLAVSLQDLAQVYEERGDIHRRLATLAEAHPLAQTLWTDAHVATAIIASSLARAHLDAGDPASAEPLLRGAVPVLTKTYGADNPRVVAAQAALARALAAQGKVEEVAAICAVVDGALAGELDDTLAAAAMQRAMAARSLSQFTTAEALALRSHAAFAAKLGETAPESLRAVAEIVAIYEAWDAVAKGQGKAEAAASWRARLR